MIDINGTVHSADVSLTTADIARFQFFSHQSRKQVDLFCIDAVVYRSVEAFKPIIDSFAFCCLPINETLQQRGDPIRRKQLIPEVADDNVVYDGNGNMPPLADGFSFLLATGARIVASFLCCGHLLHIPLSEF